MWNKNLWTVNFYFIDSQRYLHIIRTVLNRIKTETLDEIKTSLENVWQRMIQLSELFQHSFVLILKRKCLIGAGGVRCGEGGAPWTIIYTRWSNRRYELGCGAPVVMPMISDMHDKWYHFHKEIIQLLASFLLRNDRNGTFLCWIMIEMDIHFYVFLK